MAPDVVAVLLDVIDRVVVQITDARRMVRCPHCGFRTARVHDRRRLEVWDLPTRGRSTELVSGWQPGGVACAALHVGAARSGTRRTIPKSSWVVAPM